MATENRVGCRLRPRSRCLPSVPCVRIGRRARCSQMSQAHDAPARRWRSQSTTRNAPLCATATSRSPTVQRRSPIAMVQPPSHQRRPPRRVAHVSLVVRSLHADEYVLLAGMLPKLKATETKRLWKSARPLTWCPSHRPVRSRRLGKPLLREPSQRTSPFQC